MFKHAHEHLLTISKLSNPLAPIPIIVLFLCQNQSVDQDPSSCSTKSGAEVTTLLPVLPCHVMQLHQSKPPLQCQMAANTPPPQTYLKWPLPWQLNDPCARPHKSKWCMQLDHKHCKVRNGLRSRRKEWGKERREETGGAAPCHCWGSGGGGAACCVYTNIFPFSHLFKSL